MPRAPLRLLADARPAIVAFDAAERPSGPMTWSQQHLLAIIEGLRPHTASLNLRFAWPLPAGVTRPQVFDVLREMVTRHEALRTVFPGPADDLRQQALSSGHLVVEVLEVGADAPPSVVDETVETLAGRPFELTGELPVRVALLVRDDQPWHLVFSASHLVVDFAGAWQLCHGLAPLLAGSDEPVASTVAARPTPRVWQPLDQVGWESSSAGRRHGERAVAQHEQTLRAMPQTMLPRLGQEPEELRFRYTQFDSPALALAVPALAARHRVSQTAVLAAGICAVAAHVSGLERAFLQLTVGNRISARTRQAVGMFTQDVPVQVELADTSMADLFTRTEAAVMAAVRFGQYPPRDLVARRRQIELDRGVSFDLSCWLNNRRRPTPVTTPPDPPDRRTLESAARRSRCRWVGADKSSTSTYFIYADDAEDALRLTMLLDTSVLPGQEGPMWLRAVEELLCTAVVADVGFPDLGGLVDLPRTGRGDEWCRTDAGWVHLPSTTGLLRRAAGTDQCAVIAAAGDDGALLTAYLNAGRDPVDLEKLHADVVAMLPGERAAMAPHRYVACAGAPAGAGPDGPSRAGADGWTRLPVLADGTGRPTRLPTRHHATQEDARA